MKQESPLLPVSHGTPAFRPKLDKFYLIFEREIQIWPKVLVKKVTMQCTKMTTHTDACYACKINKNNHFFPYFSDLSTQNLFFPILRFIWDSHIFQKLSVVFCQSVNKHFHFLHIEVTLIKKGNPFSVSLIV